MRHVVSKTNNDFTSNILRIKPEEGMLVLFPSWLTHSVDPNMSSDERVVISFNIKDVHSYDLAQLLAQQNIFIRSGHHCAQPTMQFFQVPAMVRASLAFYNTRDEIDELVRALHKVNEVFQ